MTYPVTGDAGVPGAYLHPQEWVADAAYQGGGYWAHYGGKGTHFTEPELERLYIGAGGAQLDAPVMAAIAEQVESAGWSDAWNSSGATGLWQVEYPSSAPAGMTRAQLFSPAGNARAAAALVARSGLSPWGNDQWNVTVPPLAPSRTLPKGTTAVLTGASGGSGWNPLNWPGLIAQGAAGGAAQGASGITGGVTATIERMAVLIPVLLAAAAIAALGVYRLTTPAREKANQVITERAGQVASIAAAAA